MEKMKTIVFRSENEDFNDLLNEPCIKKASKLSYAQHIIINGEFTEKELSYLTIKYGEMMTNPFIDYKPKAYVDYVPIRK